MNLRRFFQIIEAADSTELKLAKSYALPPDPIAGRENMDDLNLPLVAFCYLIRRLTVCYRFYDAQSDCDFL